MPQLIEIEGKMEPLNVIGNGNLIKRHNMIPSDDIY